MFCFFFFSLTYSMNRLNTLPRGFGSLPALEVLDLTYNNLNENSLPGNFFYLSKELLKKTSTNLCDMVLCFLQLKFIWWRPNSNRRFPYLCFSSLNTSWIFLHSSTIFITDVQLSDIFGHEKTYLFFFWVIFPLSPCSVQTLCRLTSSRGE